MLALLGQFRDAPWLSDDECDYFGKFFEATYPPWTLTLFRSTFVMYDSELSEVYRYPRTVM